MELIGFAGKLGASGKRPRFRFSTRQQRITSYLLEIDAALASAGKEPGWLHHKVSGVSFSRRTPIEHMVQHGAAGLIDVLRFLNRLAMRAALSAPRRGTPGHVVEGR